MVINIGYNTKNVPFGVPLTNSSTQTNKQTNNNNNNASTSNRGGANNNNDDDNNDANMPKPSAEDDARFERQFYDNDDAFDASNDPFMESSRRSDNNAQSDGAGGGSAAAALRGKKAPKRTQAQRDNDKWEENRMLLSGAVSRVDPDADFDDDTEAKVQL